MAQVVRRRNIAAPPGAIWEVLADYGGLAEWAEGIDHCSLTTEQREGPGTTRRVQTGRLTILETVRRWDPGVALGYEIHGLPRVVHRAENRWRLDADDDHTSVQLTSIVEAGSGPLARPVSALVARVLARTSDRLLDGLRTRVEGTHRG